MTLQVTGPITASDINTELNVSGTAQFSINSAAARQLAGIATGQIKYSDFYGKSRDTMTWQTPAAGQVANLRTLQTYSAAGYVAASTNENGTFTLTPPAGRVFKDVLLANYGTFDVSNLGTISTQVEINITLTATNLIGGGITYTLIAGALPSGVAVAGNKIFGSVASGTVGTFNFTIRATSSTSGATDDRSFSIKITADVPLPTNVGCCGAGANDTRSVAGTTSQTFVASNGTYGDPCGGCAKRMVVILSYE